MICKDCRAWSASTGQPVPKRPATYPGPRCASHYRQKLRATKTTAHEAYVQRTYRLGPGEYAELYEFQGGVCWICRRAKGTSKKLAVDHDHKCCPTTPTCGNCTRGLLCGPCNKLLGHVRDQWETLQRGVSYLIAPPYRQMKESEDG